VAFRMGTTGGLSKNDRLWHISELALRLTWVCEVFQSRH
jgi:hypothetical protein